MPNGEMNLFASRSDCVTLAVALQATEDKISIRVALATPEFQPSLTRRDVTSTLPWPEGPRLKSRNRYATQARHKFLSASKAGGNSYE